MSPAVDFLPDTLLRSKISSLSVRCPPRTLYSGVNFLGDNLLRNKSVVCASELSSCFSTGPPSTPTVVSAEYSVVDRSTGQVTFLVSSSGAFETGVSFYGNVIGDGSVEVAGDSINVTGLSYTESHTVSVVATSAVCPGMLNGSSIDVSVMFNTKSEWNT